jgi:hypothetical protein
MKKLLNVHAPGASQREASLHRIERLTERRAHTFAECTL